MNKVGLYLGLLGCIVATSNALVCVLGKADIIFVLDSSGSVGEGNFTIMKEFVKNVTKSLYIKPPYIRVGLIKYSSTASVEFNLTVYDSGAGVLKGVDAVTYTKGGTYTNLALDTMTQEFTTHNRTLPLIGVILTDGRSKDTALTKEAAKQAKDKNVGLVSIGIGNTNDQELSDIASDPKVDFMYHVDEFKDLYSIQKEIIRRACLQSRGTLQSGESTNEKSTGASLRIGFAVITFALGASGIF